MSDNTANAVYTTERAGDFLMIRVNLKELIGAVEQNPEQAVKIVDAEAFMQHYTDYLTEYGRDESVNERSEFEMLLDTCALNALDAGEAFIIDPEKESYEEDEEESA